jgi:hypothetical protein
MSPFCCVIPDPARSQRLRRRTLLWAHCIQGFDLLQFLAELAMERAIGGQDAARSEFKRPLVIGAHPPPGFPH